MRVALPMLEIINRPRGKFDVFCSLDAIVSSKNLTNEDILKDIFYEILKSYGFSVESICIYLVIFPFSADRARIKINLEFEKDSIFCLAVLDSFISEIGNVVFHSKKIEYGYTKK